MHNILSIVLAGGKGTRLYPLTAARAKPGVPFGGYYRIIDFALSNFVNSGILKIKVLTQFKSDSLNKHLARGWNISNLMDFYVDPVPAQMRVGEWWFKGSADAVFQNLNLLEDEAPDIVCVFGGDHIYKMDIRQMLDFHINSKSQMTVATVPVPLEEAVDFGVLEVDNDYRVKAFVEKSKNPKPMPDNPDMALASMGNYIFNTDVLIDEIRKDAGNDKSVHDFGRSIVPSMVGKYKMRAYNFLENKVPGAEDTERNYWRDVGSIESYWNANMDLISVTPVNNLYNNEWPIRTAHFHHPPAKFVFANESRQRIGFATDSIVAAGSVLSGGHVDRCVLFPNVRINSFSEVEGSILFEGVEVGRHSQLKNTIVDKNVIIPPHTVIGHDLEKDRELFTVSEKGIVVVPKNYVFR